MLPHRPTLKAAETTDTALDSASAQSAAPHTFAVEFSLQRPWLPEQGPLSEAERRIVFFMTESPYYGAGNLLDRREFRETLRELSSSSHTIRLLKKEILEASLRRVKEKPGPRWILGALRRAL